MRSGRSRCLAWFFVLMLVLSPILSAGPAGLVSAQDDGAPVEEGAPAEPVVEEATETATPTETATEVTVDPPTETATTVVEAPASPTDVPATDVPATDVPATEPPATGTPTGTPVPDDAAVDGAGASAGTATPVVTTSQIAVAVSCLTDPETIRITNNGAGSVVIRGLASLYDRTAGEPFVVNRTLKAGQTAIFQAGHAAQ